MYDTAAVVLATPPFAVAHLHDSVSFPGLLTTYEIPCTYEKVQQYY